MTAGLERATARAAAYDLIGELLARGPTASARARMAQVPALNSLVAGKDADQLAADHQAILGMGVPAFGNVWLDAEGLAGGPLADRVLALGARFGWKAPDDVASADHVGAVLALMTHLLLTEVEHARHGDERAAAAARAAQGALLNEILLTWLAPFVKAVGDAGDKLYALVTATLVDVSGDHAADLGVTEPSVPGTEPGMTPATESLGKGSKGLRPGTEVSVPEDAGIGEIAGHLSSPARSGIFFSRATLAAVARTAEVPLGFGDRRGAVRGLLEGAARFDALERTLEALAVVAAQWAAWYRDLPPAMLPHAAPWARRAAATETLLRTMRAEAAPLAP